jgi:sulfide:quinone oxidoreductase
MPFGTPIPPSPDTSQAILAAFAERGITFVKDQLVKALDPGRKVAVLSDGTELPYALFLGIPVHRVPQVVVESGLAAHPHDWVPVNKQTLETRFPGVYAVGDVNGVGTPKACLRRRLGACGGRNHLPARGPSPNPTGKARYVEFGRGRVGRGRRLPERPQTDGLFRNLNLVAEKVLFGSSRLARAVGLRPPPTGDHGSTRTECRSSTW